MLISEYRAIVVQPNLDEASAAPDGLRQALNAVHAQDAYSAHIARSKGQDDLRFCNELAGRHEDFALLRDIAKALKHVELDRGTPKVARSSQVHVDSLGWGEGRWGEGRWGEGLWGGVPQVIVRGTDSEARVLLAVLKNALAALDGEI